MYVTESDFVVVGHCFYFSPAVSVNTEHVLCLRTLAVQLVNLRKCWGGGVSSVPSLIIAVTANDTEAGQGVVHF